MKKPIVKKKTVKLIKKVRPLAIPALLGTAGIAAVLSVNKRKNKKYEIKNSKKRYSSSKKN